MEALPNEDRMFWLVTGFNAAKILEGHIPYLPHFRQAYWKTQDCPKEMSGSHREQRWQRGCRTWKGRIYGFGKEDLSREVERRL